MADDGPPRLTVDVVRPSGVRAPGLAAWLQSTAPARARGTVTIALASDGRVRALNRQFRKKDQATDVLSFPAEGPAEAGHSAVDGPPEGGPHHPPEGRPHHPPEGGRHPPRVGAAFRRPRYLGDVVIALGVATRQARQAGHSLQTELRVLALHGLLHLLGYDHEHDDGRMARLERRLRQRGGLREGLIERARTRGTR